MNRAEQEQHWEYFPRVVMPSKSPISPLRNDLMCSIKSICLREKARKDSKGMDCVVLLTPVNSHYFMALEALEVGFLFSFFHIPFMLSTLSFNQLEWLSRTV